MKFRKATLEVNAQSEFSSAMLQWRFYKEFNMLYEAFPMAGYL